MLVLTVPLLSDTPVTMGVAHVQNLKLNLLGFPPVGSGTEQFDNGVRSWLHPAPGALTADEEGAAMNETKAHDQVLLATYRTEMKFCKNVLPINSTLFKICEIKEIILNKLDTDNIKKT